MAAAAIRARPIFALPSRPRPCGESSASPSSRSRYCSRLAPSRASAGASRLRSSLMSETIIAAKGLKKLYGKTPAVDGIDLAIQRGEIFGLLGPNGAGKTTTILMLLGLTEADEGTISVDGFD